MTRPIVLKKLFTQKGKLYFFYAQNLLLKHCVVTVFNAITNNGAVFKPEGCMMGK